MRSNKIPIDATIAMGIAFALVCLATLIDDLMFAAVMTPLVYLAGAYAMSRMTIRDSMLRLMFLALVLQDPNDGSPIADWSPPFAGAGAALLDHLKAPGRALGFVDWASFSVMDLLLVTLLLIAYSRRMLKSKLDTTDRLPTPTPMLRLAAVSLIGTAITLLWGLATGGEVSKALWQLNRVMYLPVLFYLFQQGLRGPQDLSALLKVIIFAAVYKSLIALFVVANFSVLPSPENGSTRPVYATGHQDSVLYATAFATLLVLLLERVGGVKRALRRTLLLLPIIGAGIWANNRRTAWVQVGAVFGAVYLMTGPNPVKRAIQRALLLLVPVLTIYLVVGWNRAGGVFAPAQTLRSVIDPKSDGSSMWRELENFDLLQTLKAYPLLGIGYGHPYLEIVKLPAVAYDLETYCPHNSLLGIWAYAGVFGFTTLTLLWVCGIYFAVRTYHAAREPDVRAGALSIVGAFVVYLIQCWADLGIGSWVGVFIIGAGLAMAGKLASHERQW
jgi:O-Antigen ligase